MGTVNLLFGGNFLKKAFPQSAFQRLLLRSSKPGTPGPDERVKDHEGGFGGYPSSEKNIQNEKYGSRRKSAGSGEALSRLPSFIRRGGAYARVVRLRGRAPTGKHEAWPSLVRIYEIPPSAIVRGEDAAGQARNDNHHSAFLVVTPDLIRGLIRTVCHAIGEVLEPPLRHIAPSRFPSFITGGGLPTGVVNLRGRAATGKLLISGPSTGETL
jgi:hypothetical protein